jgi:hypothetical protein
MRSKVEEGWMILTATMTAAAYENKPPSIHTSALWYSLSENLNIKS